jgi:carboxylesterase type B
VPVLRLADAHAKSVSATFMYEFAWRSPQFDGRLGACHGLEIAFVFDAHSEATEPLSGAHPPRSLTNAMHSAWIAFAATGDPGWPRYDLRERATMRFDTASKLVDDPRYMERRFGRVCASLRLASPGHHAVR